MRSAADMDPPPTIFSHLVLLKGLPEEAIAFFALFSRFEYALKRAGYVPHNGPAEIQWDSFANDLGMPFLHTVRASGRADAFLTTPPKAQVVVDGQLAWRAAGAIDSAQDLFGAVRRVRNNLFHGGKFSHGFVEDPTRNRDLLCQATWILEEALRCHAQVRLYFEEPLALGGS